MCAACHSTGVRKNYDPKTRRFATTYAEVNVACEACHGPGSNHVAWARNAGDWRRLEDGGKGKGLVIALDDRRGVTWTISAETGNAQRTPPSRAAREIETCGQCHGRRGQFSDDDVHGRPLGDTYRVALLADCIGCHMPTTTYMVVDPRHDHSFRVPRPDLSVKLGVPNPCTRCHAGRPAEWAARQVESWYGHAP